MIVTIVIVNCPTRQSCDQCDYKAAMKELLKKHKQSKHEGIKYRCDQCDYKSSFRQKLVINVNTSPIKQLYESAIKTYEGNEV